MDFTLLLLLGVAFIIGILFQKSFSKNKSDKPKTNPLEPIPDDVLSKEIDRTEPLISSEAQKKRSTADYSGYLDFIITNVRKILSRFSAPKTGVPAVAKKSIIPEKWIYLIGGVLMLMVGSMFGSIQAVQLAFVFAGVFLIIIATRGTAVKKGEAK